ncbi:hypothetical protein GDO81_022347 [Engystomops pustulosus]|uniref:Uncharacterized protein n=1 Tax=Engystomops pustulosus TaxID=76066 RepID=A0AAV6YR99_ENGPU|nr:hypothetical protein GDO81_022347 [Engystomops pustulosus]
MFLNRRHIIVCSKGKNRSRIGSNFLRIVFFFLYSLSHCPTERRPSKSLKKREITKTTSDGKLTNKNITSEDQKVLMEGHESWGKMTMLFSSPSKFLLE